MVEDEATEDEDAVFDEVRGRVVGLLELSQFREQEHEGVACQRRDEEAFLGAEQAVHRAGGRACGIRDRPDGQRRRTALGHQALCRGQQSSARLLVVFSWTQHRRKTRHVPVGERFGRGCPVVRRRDARGRQRQPLLRGRGSGSLRPGARGHCHAPAHRRIDGERGRRDEGPAMPALRTFSPLRTEWPLGRPLKRGKNWGGLGYPGFRRNRPSSRPPFGGNC